VQSPISPVTITLLDKQYQINCKQDEREELLESARILNLRLAEIKNSGAVIGLERIAIMAALNISHELVRVQKDGNASDVVSSGIERLQEKIGSAINSLNSANKN